MKVGTIIQARMKSTRVPNKVALEFGGKPLLWHIVARLKKSKKSDELIIATGPEEQNKWIVEFAKKNKIECFTHDDEKNALARIYFAAKKYHLDQIVRVCADNIFVCTEEIDQLISEHLRLKSDFSRNVTTLHPDLGAEIITFEALKMAHREATSAYDKEHVCTYIYKTNPGKFIISDVGPCLHWPVNIKNYSFVLDTREDVENIAQYINKLFNGKTPVATKSLIKYCS